VTNGRYRSDTEELDRGSVCRKTGVSPEVEMDVVTGVELECSYGAGDGRTRSGVVSMPKERSGGPRLDRSCDWKSMDMTRTHPRSVERLSRLERYRQPSLSILHKVKTILMRRMNTSSLQPSTAQE